VEPVTSLRKIDKSLIDLEGYQRIDNMLAKILSDEEISKHALHGTLCGNSLIEVYEIYFNKQKGELLCLVHFGTELNGHPQVVHGGITATVFDNSFGWLYAALKLPIAFTAALTVNYRNKVSEDSTVILRAKVKEVVGRKMFFIATLHDLQGSLLADSTSLFISARPAAATAAVTATTTAATSTATSTAATTAAATAAATAAVAATDAPKAKTTSEGKPFVLSAEIVRQQLFVSRGVIS
jgi:acyl-coenzyme A thioesterase PaaI-like protein